MTNNPRIVILGWGSLIRDPRELADHVQGSWTRGGPILPIEFSRVSDSRKGALTLVIDPENGVDVPTRSILSSRKNPEDAVCDLRVREGTMIDHIGLVNLETGFIRSKWPNVTMTIRTWAEQNGFDVVLWTDLPSNFSEKTGMRFCLGNAVKHLKDLQDDAAEEARQYIERAPEEVDTPLRQRLRETGWLDPQIEK
jgi:hypothetical protein